MKQKGKKPRAKSASQAASPPGAGAAPKRKKRRKKPGTREKIHAVTVAAALIAAALLISLALTRRRSAAVAETPPEAAPAAVEAPVKPAPPEDVRVPAAPPPPPVKPEPVKEAPPPAPPVSGQAPVVSAPARTMVSGRQAAPTPGPGRAPAVTQAAPVSRAPAPAPRTVPVQPRARQPEEKGTPAVSLSPQGIPERPPGPPRGVLAFVIDDAGNNLRDLEPFLKLPMPLTIAVLPGLAHSAEAARRIRAAGKEVFLHQPMEPLGGQNPGPGAITAGMGGDEIRAVINRNLAEVGPVAGINNHEGSRVTMNEEAMETVLSLCREKGLVFLDSRTTAETAAPLAARRLGITIGERDIFVDNEKDRESMRGFINTGLKKAEQKGLSIMIGHAGSQELAPLLSDLYSELIKRGYSFSQMSKIIELVR